MTCILSFNTGKRGAAEAPCVHLHVVCDVLVIGGLHVQLRPCETDRKAHHEASCSLLVWNVIMAPLKGSQESTGLRPFGRSKAKLLLDRNSLVLLSGTKGNNCALALPAALFPLKGVLQSMPEQVYI